MEREDLGRARFERLPAETTSRADLLGHETAKWPVADGISSDLGVA
jgi:hypothetical protein